MRFPLAYADCLGLSDLIHYPLKVTVFTSMKTSGPGFAVLYRWRLHPGKESLFIEGWSKLSELFLIKHGSLGSRLHKGPEGVWYSYAQWPNSAVRDQAFAGSPVDLEAEQKMQEAILESLPALVLESVADFMVSPTR